MELLASSKMENANTSSKHSLFIDEIESKEENDMNINGSRQIQASSKMTVKSNGKKRNEMRPPSPMQSNKKQMRTKILKGQ